MPLQHLLIPFAAPLSEAGLAACGTLALPNLARLLARWTLIERDEGDAYSLSPPHERALASAWGWTAPDGLLPFAAQAAADDGFSPASDGTGWGLLRPTHWHADAQQVSVTDPAALRLEAAAARVFFDALAPLFTDDGWALRWGAPDRWYATHTSLTTLPTASLDRVVGRDIDLWLQSHPQARRLRRLQAEAQMLLHAHPLNAEREGQGLLPVNSFWLSGTGVSALADPARRAAVQVDERLRAPALAEDWATWAEAWQRLDAEVLPALVSADPSADTSMKITLCGERNAHTWAPRPQPLWQRWLGPRQVNPLPLLSAL